MARATNHRLKVAREKKQKKEEIVERWKVKTLGAKWRKARKRISFSNEKENESDIKDNIDLNQANNKYQLQL